MLRDYEIDAKVIAVNRVNEGCYALYRNLSSFFMSYVGQKVVKADGSLLQKIEKLMPALPNGGPLHVYRHQSKYSLCWVVRTSEPTIGYTTGGTMTTGGCLYHEQVVSIGELQGDVLTSITSPFQGRTDYNAQEVRDGRARVKEAEKALSAAKDSCWPYDS